MSSLQGIDSLEGEAASEISEVFRGREDNPSGPKAKSATSFLEDVEFKCILEPVCLDTFIFSQCPHPEVDCARNRYERKADREGERTYGFTEWKQLKRINPAMIVQMIGEVRDRENLATR